MSDAFMAMFCAAMAGTVLQQFFPHSRRSQRRMYWSCASAAAVFGSLAAYPPWTRALGACAFIAVVMIVVAYVYTPYIKMRAKIYSLGIQSPDPDDVTPGSASGQHDPAPDGYSGTLTAAKMWWILVPLMFISAGNTYAFATGDGEWWVAAIGVAFLLFLAIATGYGDASWGYPIARGQRIQFALLAVITLGTFTIVYLAAYAMARRRPVRSKHSLEYRAHPHLREKYPDTGEVG